jgi:deoxyribodipyrimidine photo-lyase
MPLDPRLRVLRDGDARTGRSPRYVLYWMQASQRVAYNHALAYAIRQANRLRLPVVACFGLMDDYPEANARHYLFLLQGLRDVAQELSRRRIAFVVRRGAPPRVALELSRRAALVVCDRGYTRHQRRWRDELADGATCPVHEVESDVVVPVEGASDKQEFAARTLRPKLHRQLDRFLVPVRMPRLERESLSLKIAGDVDVSDPDAALARLTVDQSVAPVPRYFIGGEREARQRLNEFVRHNLTGYAQGRNHPETPHTSTLAAYLHFGQISPIEVALAVRGADHAPAVDRHAFLEELIVRRELTVNYVHHCPRYDAYEGLPMWAKQTLARHASDPRQVRYSLAQLERAATHDEYWNAAQREMLITGYMQNAMRMYWGKKIIEWSPSPRAAYDRAVALNNKYFLCGRDPASWANVAWLFGLHDRPWGPERPIFGLVRYMNAHGLERKFDVAAYVERVNAMQPLPQTMSS